MTIHLPKINEVGGGAGGGGGDGKFPTFVTDSGSSLPVDLSGYQLNDTFLDTTDKKIYKASADSYSLNAGVTNTATFDSTTGVVNEFSGTTFQDKKNIYKSFTWSGYLTFQVKFKFTSANSGDRCIIDFNVDNNTYGNGIAFFLTNDKIHYVRYTDTGYSSYTKNTDTEIIDYTLETNKEYILVIKKTGTSCIADLKFDSSTISSNSFEVPNSLTATNEWVCLGTKKASTVVPFTDGYIYLGETSGNFVVADLSWDTGTDLTDKTEYADKTNGILYLYENEVLNAIPNLTDYQKKAETITISTASVTIANVQANKNYVLSSSALTDITLSGCETSFEETSIEFTTGTSAPTLTDNSGITWVDGSPTFNASKSYLIVIFNKLGFVKEY